MGLSKRTPPPPPVHFVHDLDFSFTKHVITTACSSGGWLLMSHIFSFYSYVRKYQNIKRNSFGMFIFLEVIFFHIKWSLVIWENIFKMFQKYFKISFTFIYKNKTFVYIYVPYSRPNGWTDWAEIFCGQSWVAGGW